MNPPTLTSSDSIVRGPSRMIAAARLANGQARISVFGTHAANSG